MLGQWTLNLETFRDYTTELTLKDESGNPLNLSGYFLKFEIIHDDGIVEWSTETDHLQIQSPTTDGKAILTVPKSEIADLPFDWANFRFFVGADEDNPELVYEGKVNLKK